MPTGIGAQTACFGKTVTFACKPGTATSFAEVYARDVMTLFARHPGCVSYSVLLPKATAGGAAGAHGQAAAHADSRVEVTIVFESEAAFMEAVRTPGMKEAKAPLTRLTTGPPVFRSFDVFGEYSRSRYLHLRSSL